MMFSVRFILFLAIAKTLAAQTLMNPPSTKSAVEGTVLVVGNEAPIARAEVFLSDVGSQERMVLATRTDASGRFAFPNVEPGRYTISANRRGFVAGGYSARLGARTVIEIYPGEQLRDLAVHLIPVGAILGHVTGKDDEPLAGVQVRAWMMGYRRGRRQLLPIIETSTNDLGEFRLYGLQPASYYVSASELQRLAKHRADGTPEESYILTFYPGVSTPKQAVSVRVSPGGEASGTNISLLRNRTVHLSGRLLGASRESTEPVWVSLRSLDAEFDFIASNAQARNAPVSRDGKFEFGGIASGSYLLFATQELGTRSFRAWQRVNVGNGDIDGANLTFTSPIELRGRVRLDDDHSEKPRAQRVLELSQLSVQLHGDALTLQAAYTAPKVESDGSFFVELDEPGAYEISLTAMPEDFYLKSVRLGPLQTDGRTINVSDSSVEPLELVVNSRGGRVEGLGRDEEGEPIAGATIVLVPEETLRMEHSRFRQTNADQNGHFSIRGIPPGDYKLLAWDVVELGAWEDPEFLKTYEEKGRAVKIDAGSNQTVDVQVILSGR
jgi:hypothetical protein